MLVLQKLWQQRVTRDSLNCLYLGERLWQMLTRCQNDLGSLSDGFCPATIAVCQSPGFKSILMFWAHPPPLSPKAEMCHWWTKADEETWAHCGMLSCNTGTGTFYWSRFWDTDLQSLTDAGPGTCLLEPKLQTPLISSHEWIQVDWMEDPEHEQ